MPKLNPSLVFYELEAALRKEDIALDEAAHAIVRANSSADPTWTVRDALLAQAAMIIRAIRLIDEATAEARVQEALAKADADIANEQEERSNA